MATKQQNQEDNNNEVKELILEKRRNTRDKKDTKVRQGWSWNNRTIGAYNAKGVKKPDNLYGEELRFLSQVDPTGKHPIVRSVRKIVRFKAPDPDDEPYHKEKEWLVYYEDWNGKNYQGQPIAPANSHVHGEYDSPMVQDVIDKYGDVVGTKFIGKEKKYYIPFSKKAVDDIIATSDNTDKSNINFTFKGSTFRNDKYSYEQFANYDYDLMIELMSTKGGPAQWEHWQKFDVQERQERFKKYAQVT